MSYVSEMIKHRKALGLTQEQLAEQAKLSRATISQIEIGRQLFDGPAREAIERALESTAKSRLGFIAREYPHLVGIDAGLA